MYSNTIYIFIHTSRHKSMFDMKSYFDLHAFSFNQTIKTYNVFYVCIYMCMSLCI